MERGTRRAVAGAAVLARAGGDSFTDTSGPDGAFRIAVPQGELEVRVAAFGYRRFLQNERLERDQKLRVKYLLERESYNLYESVIVGQRERTEISRTTLRGRETDWARGWCSGTTRRCSGRRRSPGWRSRA